MVKNLPAVQETWLRSLGWEDPLERGMATHSSILAWRIPWTEKPGGLQSMGSQRVGHGWATNTHSHTHINSIYVSIPISQFHIYVLIYDICFSLSDLLSFPHSSAGKESTCYTLQYSGLENSMDYMVHGVAKSRMWLSDFHFTPLLIYFSLYDIL